MIEAKNLQFTYPTQTMPTIRGIDFSICRGEIFGFLGPSGAGKTTTQKLLIGLLRGYQGSIQILGRERSLWSQDFFESVGVGFDFPNLYTKLTAKENLTLIGAYYQKKNISLDSLLDKVDLLKEKDKKVEGFSKGMKMRLNFIRALIHDPQILFFDEPTSGLDPVNAKIIKDMLLEQKRIGKTIFLTTHNMTVAEQLCDQVAFISDGAIDVIDKPSSLKRKYGTQIVNISYQNGSTEEKREFSLQNLSENKEFLEILRNHPIISIHSGETTLEDIFIRLTGRTLQ